MKINGLILMILLIICGITGFMIGTSQNPMNQAFRQAQTLGSKGVKEKEMALKILNQQGDLIKLSIRNAQNENTKKIIALSLAEKLIENEMWNLALPYLEMAKDITPGNYGVNYKLGLVYLNQFILEKNKTNKVSYYQKSLIALNTALMKEPDGVEANYLMGVLHYQNKTVTLAIPYFQSVLQKNPNHMDSLFGLARCYYDIKELDKAKKIYLKIETIIPKNSPQLEQVENNLSIINQTLRGN